MSGDASNHDRAIVSCAWVARLMLTVLLLPATAGAAEVAGDEIAPPAGTPIRAPRGGDATAEAAKGSGASMPAFAQVAIALTTVIAAILLLRWMMQRMMSGGGHRPSRAIQVLASTMIAPRQQLMLVQVGRRIVVVGGAGGQMSALCEISDPEEVAELVGQIEQQKSESITNTFAALFRREKEKFQAAQEHDPVPAPELQAARSELSGLSEKVRLISRQFRS